MNLPPARRILAAFGIALGPVIAFPALVAPCAFARPGPPPESAAAAPDREELARAAAAFRAAYERRGRPPIEVTVNERIGPEGAQLRDAVADRLTGLVAAAAADPGALGESGGRALTRFNRLTPGKLGPWDARLTSPGIGVLVALEARPTDSGFELFARVFEARPGVTVVERAFGPLPERWTRTAAADRADTVVLGLFESLAALWTAEAPTPRRVEITGAAVAERRGLIAEALGLLPDAGEVAEPGSPDGAGAGAGAWGLAGVGSPERFALAVRDALRAALRDPPRLEAWDDALVRFTLPRRGEPERTLFHAGYERAGRPRVAVLFNVFTPVVEPGSPERPLLIGGGVSAEIELDARPDQFDDGAPVARYHWELRGVNRMAEELVQRALMAEGAECIDPNVLRTAPFKGGRTPQLREDRLVRLAVSEAREFAALVVVVDAFVERRADETPGFGTVRFLARVLDTRSGVEVARAEESLRFEVEMLRDGGPSRGPRSASEGAAMRLADRLVRALTGRWLAGRRYLVRAASGVKPEEARAIACWLADSVPGVLGGVTPPGGSADSAAIWFEGSPAAFRRAVAEARRSGGPPPRLTVTIEEGVIAFGRADGGDDR